MTLSSCLEQIGDTDKLANNSFSPAIAVPLANGSFTAEEFLTNGKTTGYVENRNGDIVFVYNNRLVTPSASTLFKIPAQNPKSVSVDGAGFVFPSPGGQIQVAANSAYTITTSGTMHIDSISFKNGDVVFEVDTDFPASLSVKITFPSMTSSAGMVQKTIDLPYSGTAGRSVTDSLSFASLTADLTDNGTTFNTLPYQLEITATDDGQPIVAGQTTSISLQLKQLEFDLLYGQMGTIAVASKVDSLITDVFNNIAAGEIVFEAPALHMEFTNEFGIDADVDLGNLKARRGGSTLSLSGSVTQAPDNPHLLARTASPFDAVGKSSTIEITTQNSNLKDFINLFPSIVYYGFQGTLNPPSAGTAEQFIRDTSKIVVNWGMELPLFATINNLEVTKVFDFNGVNIDELGDIDIIQHTSNGMPLAVNVQLYFLDANNAVLDSLYDDADVSLIAAAPVDNNGLSSGATEVSKTTLITAGRRTALDIAKRLMLKATLNTSNNGTMPVKIGANDRLSLEFGLEGHVSYSF